MPLVALELFYGTSVSPGSSVPLNLSTSPGGEPLHPPYGRSTLQPRVLQRWLDVNSQNGKLGRFQQFITIPSFGPLVNNWNGFSDIIATFNYASPNNFSLKELPSFFLYSVNFLLCVAFLDNNNSVVRFSLNPGIGETINFPLIPYKGQPILKNFRLEVWSIKGLSPVLFSVSPSFYTSVLGDMDYRYGIDTALTGSSLINTSFGAPIGVAGCVPLIFPASSYFIPQNVNVPGIAAVNGICFLDSITGLLTNLQVSDETITLTPNAGSNPVGNLEFTDSGTGAGVSLSVANSAAVLTDNAGAGVTSIPIVDTQTNQIVYLFVKNNALAIT